ELASTALTWLPAPMAYSISVVEGESETMAAGRDRTCTTPIAVVIEAGNAPVAGVPPAIEGLELELPHAAADQARAAGATRAARRRERYRMIILRRVVEDEVRPLRRREASERTALPPRTDRWRGSGVRAHPRPQRPGASPLRDSAGFAPASLGSAPSRAGPRTGVPYRSRARESRSAGGPTRSRPEPHASSGCGDDKGRASACS